MALMSFRATIRRHGPGSWSFIEVPRSESAKLGTRARVAVRGSVNGVAVRTSLFPTGDGAFTMVINATVRAGAHAEEGDPVAVLLDPDTAKRVIRPPTDLAALLKKTPSARRTWAGLSYSHRKEYVEWLRATKNPETRARRLRSAIERLASGAPLND